MIERRTIRFDHELLAGLELPCFEAHGNGDGPHLCLLAGIHGGEYSSIAAVVRFMNALDTRELRGRITAVPIVSMPSFRARLAFAMPQDGKNLNRCFPGSPEGTFSDVLAHCVFDELIAPSDFMLDLHGGDMVEALEPFSLYDESPVEEQARDLAIAFGLPYLVRSAPAEAPISGTTTGAAAAASIPAVIAEVGGCGLLEEDAVRTHVDGIENALRHLRMLPGDVTPPRADMRSVGRFVWIRSTEEGWWEAGVRAGDEVRAGSSLGTMRNLFGDVTERIPAPEDGVVLFLTTSPAVAAEGLLLGLGLVDFLGLAGVQDVLHGKEGVDGSSPSEGFTKGQQVAFFVALVVARRSFRVREPVPKTCPQPRNDPKFWLEQTAGGSQSTSVSGGSPPTRYGGCGRRFAIGSNRACTR